jgi:hypothetical protein
MDKIYALAVGVYKGVALTEDGATYKAIFKPSGKVVFLMQKYDTEEFLKLGIIKELVENIADYPVNAYRPYAFASLENKSKAMTERLKTRIINADLTEVQDLFELFEYMQACIQQLSEETRELYNKQR